MSDKFECKFNRELVIRAVPNDNISELLGKLQDFGFSGTEPYQLIRTTIESHRAPVIIRLANAYSQNSVFDVEFNYLIDMLKECDATYELRNISPLADNIFYDDGVSQLIKVWNNHESDIRNGSVITSKMNIYYLQSIEMENENKQLEKEKLRNLRIYRSSVIFRVIFVLAILLMSNYFVNCLKDPSVGNPFAAGIFLGLLVGGMGLNRYLGQFFYVQTTNWNKNYPYTDWNKYQDYIYGFVISLITLILFLSGLN